MARLLLVTASVIGMLAGCASTAAPQTEGERIATALRGKGLDVANLRPIRVGGRRAEVIAENIGFDIPGIRLEDEPAGTIRIYKREREAQSEARVFKLLGRPGPETRLDYVTVRGTRELILDYSLPLDLAQRYIDAFMSAP